MLPKRIEEASLNAWPALQHMLYDGWILRFSKGYSKRANSINPLFAADLDVADKIAACTRLYAAHGLPPIFRLTPFASPPDLDRLLAERHYTLLDTTHVLYRDLQNDQHTRGASGAIHTTTLDDWLAHFCQYSATAVALHHTHKEILQAIPGKRCLAVLSDAGSSVACGLGVLEQDYFGLFDLVTDPQRRHQGYGARLVSCMLQWAQERGARHAYLQVLQHNAAARHLYEKLGFREVYQYWYRVPPAHSGSW